MRNFKFSLSNLEVGPAGDVEWICSPQQKWWAEEVMWLIFIYARVCNFVLGYREKEIPKSKAARATHR
jgi:hypothetical protein